MSRQCGEGDINCKKRHPLHVAGGCVVSLQAILILQGEKDFIVNYLIPYHMEWLQILIRCLFDAGTAAAVFFIFRYFLSVKSHKLIIYYLLSVVLSVAAAVLAGGLIIRFLNQMDTDGINVTARSYAMQITNFSYCAGAALAQANAILTGWRIGAGKYEECDKGTRKAAVIGVVAAAVLESAFAASSGILMRMFTEDSLMIALVGRLLAIDILLEIGRTTNLVFGNALKTSGDAVFTTVIAAVFMYLCAVGGTWFFGIHLGWMVAGAYVGLAMDECVRAVCMYFRWRSGKWKEKVLISTEKLS